MEELLHYVWKHRLFPLKRLETTDGCPLEVIDPGLPNPHAGPDFFNAKVKIGGVVWAGHVEIHLRASDWARHGHPANPAYDSVILHVASDIDATVCRTDGSPIPQLELHYPPYLQQNYEELLQTARYPACYRLIPRLPRLTLHSWLTSLQLERFEAKTRQIEEWLQANGQDWEQAFFLSLARSFGFGVNSDLYERWARTLPLAAVNKHRDDLFQIEALFFGQAGLLQQDPPADDYQARLGKEYDYLKHKFDLPPSPEGHWSFLRMRPGNFPTVRIAQLAALYHRSQGLLSQLMEADTLQQLRRLLTGEASVYWTTHYLFGEPSVPRPKRLSQSSADLLIINTVVPFLYAYGKRRGDERLCLRASRLLEELKPENNTVTRMWSECGLTAAHAADSQALLQLKKNYCDPKKCLFCRIGYEYFKADPATY